MRSDRDKDSGRGDTVYVGGLPFELQKADVWKACEDEYGRVTNVSVRRPATSSSAVSAHAPVSLRNRLRNR